MAVQGPEQTVLGVVPTAQSVYRLRGLASLCRDVMRRPSGAVAVLVIALIVLAALFAPLLAPHNPDTLSVGHALASPTQQHLLGTDSLGRDNFSRLIYGTRPALLVSLPAVLGAFLVGALLGLISGYRGGFTDRVLIVIFDAFISFPAVILALALLTFLGPSIQSIALVIGLSLMPYYARLVRAQTISERTNDYVKAERSLGASRIRVLRVHILPNVLPPLLVVVAMDIGGAVGIETGLAFLGVGVQPPAADWGVMLADGFAYIGTSPWEIVGPIAALIVMMTAFTVLGETLRDAMDPRHRPPRRFFRARRRSAK